MKRTKMILALLGALLLLFTFGGLYSLAYLNQTTNSVTNYFAGSTLDITVNEDFEDGDMIKENVKIENTGDVPMYVRVKLLVQVEDENGIIIANPIVVDDLSFRGIDMDDFEISEINNWVEIDGYYYYQELINPGEEVLFFESASLKEDVVFRENYTPVLTISAQGVQANAIELGDVWNEIQIDENNKLIQSVED